MYSDDGTSYTLPAPSGDVPDEQWSGGTWRYVGQYAYSTAAPSTGPQYAVPGSDLPVDPYDGVRVDAFGRQWALVGEQATTQVPSEARTGFDGLPAMPDPRGEVELQSWNIQTCSTDTHAHWDTDDRASTDMSAMNKAQKASVVVFRFDRIPDDGALRWVKLTDCSGTLLENNYVLTAGHCVSKRLPPSSGFPHPPEWAMLPANGLVVCTKGNEAVPYPYTECRVGSSVAAASAWLSESTGHQDFGVIVLGVPFGEHDTMTLTTRAASTWDDFLFRNLAYPLRQRGTTGGDPTCASNQFSNDRAFPTATMDGQTFFLNRREQYRNTLNFSEADLSTNEFHYRGENCTGASGSAIFICPGAGGCANNAEIIALHTSYSSSGTFRFNGPRVEEFSSFVSANAP